MKNSLGKMKGLMAFFLLGLICFSLKSTYKDQMRHVRGKKEQIGSIPCLVQNNNVYCLTHFMHPDKRLKENRWLKMHYGDSLLVNGFVYPYVGSESENSITISRLQGINLDDFRNYYLMYNVIIEKDY